MMASIFQTVFEKDFEQKKVFVQRTFNAPLDLVWSAWTEKEILDEWWAPKPFKSKTKYMNFENGGRRFYAMVTPEGQEHWMIQEYSSITPKTSFKTFNVFTDKDENREPYGSEWTYTFSEENGVTKVSIEIFNESLERMKKQVEMGFEQGFAMAHQNLDQYIQEQFALWIQNKMTTKARVTTYLNFPGNTEEAMNFYKSVFETEFIGNGIQRFGDIPTGDGYPPVAENVKKMVLHVELPITGNHIVMATDAPKELGFTVTPGNNMHICIEPETRVETKKLFDALAEGGNVSMPLADMFWGAYFGSCTDKFGINWMFNCTSKD